MLIYIATIIVSTSIGLLVGGLLAASKVSYLTDKLDQMHMLLNFQVKVIEDLTATARRLLEIPDESSSGHRSEAIVRLQLALREGDKAIAGSQSVPS